MDLNKLKTLRELREFAESLLKTNVELQQKAKIAEDKLEHLEKMLAAQDKFSVGSNEENLCKIEIKRLYDKAKSQPLEFNEVKSFEIFVKSLYLIKGKVPDAQKASKKEVALSQDQLIQLALQATDESSEQ